VFATDSPVQNAVGAASLVILIAMVLFSVAAYADAWPALVMMAYGAALGAGVAINAITARGLDMSASTSTAATPAALLQGLTLATPIALAWSLWLDDRRLLIVPVVLAGVWSWQLWLLTGVLERGGSESADGSVYRQAFQLMTLAFVICLLYGAVATDTPWLWRPTVWDHFQGPIWFVVLEFAALPLSLRIKPQDRASL
jgi:hypothetical protein